MSRSLIKSIWALGACAVAVVVLFSPATLAAGSATGMSGTVSMTSGSIPAGSQIIVYHLATEQTFTAVLGSGGGFELTGLPPGYFDVAIRTPQGLYVTDRVVNVKAGKLEKVTVKLGPASDAQARSFPGSSGATAGVASVTPKSSPFMNFIRTPGGTATVAVVGAGVIAVAVGDGSSDSSPLYP